MNKYQKALNKIVKSNCPNCHDENGYTSCDIEKICNATAKDWVDTLQELVEKETPKKPIEIEEKDIVVGKIIIYNCPSCNHGLFVKFIEINRVAKYKSNYCEVCGQALDWSEKDV